MPQPNLHGDHQNQRGKTILSITPEPAVCTNAGSAPISVAATASVLGQGQHGRWKERRQSASAGSRNRLRSIGTGSRAAACALCQSLIDHLTGLGGIWPQVPSVT